MKLIKLMTVTALTMGAVLGAVVEPANAAFFGGGRSYSYGSALPELFFDLVTQTGDGATIEPTAENSSVVFSNAVEDFIYRSRAIELISPGSEDNIAKFTFDLGDLKAEFVPGEELVRYTFLSDQIQLELTDINDGELDEGFGIEAPSLDSLITFDLDISNVPEQDRNDYVNSLSFIIENNLLSSDLVTEIKLTDEFGKDLFEEDLDFPTPLEDNTEEFEIVVTDLPNRSTTVPEPGTVISLLTTGTLCVRLLKKHKA